MRSCGFNVDVLKSLRIMNFRIIFSKLCLLWNHDFKKMFLCLSTDSALEGNSIKPRGVVPQPRGVMSCVSLVEDWIL